MSDGTFEIPGVNFAMSGHYFLVVPPGRGCRPLVHILQGGVADLDLRRQPGQMADARLLDPEGKPMVGVKMYVYPMPETENHEAYQAFNTIQSDSPTDGSGVAKFSTLGPGTFRVSTEHDHTIERDAGEGRDFQLPEDVGDQLTFRVRKR